MICLDHEISFILLSQIVIRAIFQTLKKKQQFTDGVKRDQYHLIYTTLDLGTAGKKRIRDGKWYGYSSAELYEIKKIKWGRIILQ